MEKKFLTVLLLVFIVFASGGSKFEVEGATCTKPSKYFKGICGYDSSCATACQKENWPGGSCHQNFLSFTCVCERPC